MKLLPMIAGAALAAVVTAASSAQLGPTSLIENANPPPQGTVTGDATGRVVFEGEKPEMKPITIDAEKAKGCVHEGETVDNRDQSLLIGKDNGVANVVVLVEVAGAQVKVPEKPIELDQKKCQFEPHVLCAPLGASMEFVNSDTISHNVHTYPSKNEAFNQTIQPGGKHVQKLEKSDRINIKCDIHPWMSSWLVVTETPYVAVTGVDGTFKIAGLPAGEHKVTYWHETLGKASGTIKVGPDGKTEPIEQKMGLEKKGGRRR